MDTNKLIQKLVQQLDYLSQRDVKRIKAAIEFAQTAHEGQLRKSGEPYVNHALATALILTELKVDANSIIAGLLHDVIEDTAITGATIHKQFGQEVLNLVDGVTKVSHVRLNTNHSVDDLNAKYLESLRKLFLAMAKDYRVVLIKLADRLHNMRTLQYVPVAKQNRIATETIEIYVPLANRLGLWTIKSDLEDVCFKYLHPKEYTQLFEEVKDKTARGQNFIKKTISHIKRELTKHKTKFVSISGRTKNLYSIYLKTINKNQALDEIYDIYAIRIITKNIKECYAALGVIHSLWRPIPGRFKDYISVPKPNGYRSLHTSVFAANGQKLEIQIRTEEMHRHAEHGIAAHWLYKEKTGKKEYDWIKELENLKNVDIKELSRQLKIDIFEDRIFVYTPNGDVIDLPAGSTPVDFAFHIHSDLGHRLIGAKAGGKIVPLDYQILSGDILEILTAKTATGPKREWLDFAQTSNAKSKIRSWLKKKNYRQNLIDGEAILSRETEKLNLPSYQKVDPSLIKKLLDELPYKNFDDILVAISTGDVSPKKVIKCLYPESEILQPKTSPKTTKQPASRASIVFGQNQRLNYKLSGQCCQPKYPRPIIGYITRGKGITVHNLDCKNVANKDTNRLIPARWEKLKGKYTVDLEIHCDDQVGMLHRITGVIVQDAINLEDIKTLQPEKNYAKIKITVNVNSLDDLTSLMDKLSRLPGIKTIKRI